LYIFNIFFVLEIIPVVNPLPFQYRYNLDISDAVLSNVFLFFFMFTDKKRFLDRWEGVIFIIMHVLYISFLVYKK